MDEAVHDLIKVYLAQIQSAIKISKIICEHGNREELTGDDIICGLVYRLITPMPEDELVEVTPKSIRLRKIELDENKRLSQRKKDKITN